MKPLELPYSAPLATATEHEHSEPDATPDTTPDTRQSREAHGARLRPERAHRNRRPLMEPLGEGKRNVEENEQ